MKVSFPNIRHMRAFLKTANNGSVSIAADKCHLSQPAAAQAIKKLEARYGTPLLARKRKVVILTPCGILLAERAAKALAHLKAGAYGALKEAGCTTR